VSNVDSGVAPPRRSAWRRRRRARVTVLTGTAVVVVALASAATVGLGGKDPAAAPSTTPAGSTVQVVKETLVDFSTVDGKLSHGTATPIESKLSGTVTWLAPVGSTISRGGAVLRVDDRPVALLYGPLPMYRPLAEAVEGRDVEQFEANLRELGYRGFSVDETYSKATIAAVKLWQRDLGLPETGRVDLGQVTYTPAAVRVDQQLVRVGASATGDVLACTSTTKVVTVDLAAGDSAWAVKNAAVTVTLPDGSSLPGVVTDVGTQATMPGGNTTQSNTDSGQEARAATIQAVISIRDQSRLARWDQAPVSVRHVADERKDVLTVPVAALLALAEGGYGLEIVEAGSSRFVAVQPGLFAGGRVEVHGTDVRAGMMVRIPQ
jgi:multidrug efflux system membrane fusion protein